MFCVRAIEQEKFAIAYEKYKKSILYLEEIYARPYLEIRLIGSLKKVKKTRWYTFI